MRLFDKVISQVPHSRNIIPSDTVVLCADPIAEHYAKHDKAWWGPEDYPYATPPWKHCFVEWNTPRLWVMEEGAIIAGKRVGERTYEADGNSSRQSGVFFKTVPATEALIASATQAAAASGHVINVSSSRHIASCFWFFEHGGTARVMSVFCFAFLDSNGTVIERVISGEGLRQAAERNSDMCAIERMLDSQLHVAYLAFTFANCSNVKLDDSTEELQPPPKIRRRLKIPEVKRYTLNIAGHVSRPSRDYNQGPQGVMPFHLCRGHFATYTAEKPMFGNPKLVGRYWHPPHMKGKKENGEIIKDYAIRDATE